MTLTVREAAATYERAMRNVLPAGPGVCATCHTFIDEEYSHCYRCNNQPDYLDVVVPITYSEHLGQMHTALRNYKEGLPQAQTYAMTRLASILWLFLEAHEQCVARAAGAESFEVVTVVPSSSPAADEKRANLRWIVGQGCEPTADRFARALEATGDVPADRREFDTNRYRATRSLPGADVLLIDDSWVTGSRAQAAGAALRTAGARTVAMVAIGRHLRPEWVPGQGGGPTSGELLASLPREFDWTNCCVE